MAAGDATGSVPTMLLVALLITGSRLPPARPPRSTVLRLLGGQSEWTQHTAQDGRTFYYNTRTQQSSWEPPAGFGAAADEWTECAAADGRVFYYCERTGERQWTLPAGARVAAAAPPPAPAALPDGWSAHTNADGSTYYYNSYTGESSWDPPVYEL